MKKLSELILYKDHQLIVFNKPSTIPVQTDLTDDKSLQNIAETYAKQTLHLVHRLDRPASGITIFARTKATATALSQQWQAKDVEKTYLAVVKNLPDTPQGTLIHYLRKTNLKTAKAYKEEQPNTQRAELTYKHLKSTENYHFLEINLITGRFHQIRAQLAAIGSPIKGDVKYGARRNNEDRSIHLHAWKIAFVHPVSGEKIALEAPLPEDDALWKAFAEEDIKIDKTE